MGDNFNLPPAPSNQIHSMPTTSSQLSQYQQATQPMVLPPTPSAIPTQSCLPQNNPSGYAPLADLSSASVASPPYTYAPPAKPWGPQMPSVPLTATAVNNSGESTGDDFNSLQSKVKTLTGMGFDAIKVQQILIAKNGDQSAALDALLADDPH